MGSLKKLTEQSYKELDSMKRNIFNRSYEGRLNPFNYEILSLKVKEMGLGYDVSEFENFLLYHRGVYEMRKRLVQ